MVIPFGLPARWMEGYMRGEAPEAKGKERSRCQIRDASAGRAHSTARHTEEKQTAEVAGGRVLLTVPVEGGAAVLKKRGANPVLSEHGKWRREHLGAWQAAYGRTPYYEHLMPEIEAVYADSHGITLDEFNRRLLEVAKRWISYSGANKNSRTDAHSRPRNEIIKAVGSELRCRIDPELSIFDAIFRLGKETALIFDSE